MKTPIKNFNRLPATMEEYDAQELFMYQGTLVWKKQENQVYDLLELVEYPRGYPFTISWTKLKSASPADLEEAGI